MTPPPAPRWVPPRWLRLPRRTVRLRLTLVYGGLFLLSGAGLLTITYFLVAQRLTVGPITNRTATLPGQPAHRPAVRSFSRPEPAPAASPPARSHR